MAFGASLLFTSKNRFLNLNLAFKAPVVFKKLVVADTERETAKQRGTTNGMDTKVNMLDTNLCVE